MRDRFYGDQRDLVKWSVALHLAEEFELGSVLQVAYLRPSRWPDIDVNGRSQQVPASVLNHFRRIHNVEALCEHPRIEVLDEHFVDRTRYLSLILETIAAIPREEQTLVFLDPDTGLQPRRPSLDHVLDEEVAHIWRELRLGDVLMLYQHQTNRAGRPWVEEKRLQLASALTLAQQAVKTASSVQMAPDVVFFYCQKTSAA